MPNAAATSFSAAATTSFSAAATTTSVSLTTITLTNGANIPFTTLYTPSTDCFNYVSSRSSNIVLPSLAYCFPNGMNAFSSAFVYSPALWCPGSYTTASTTTITNEETLETRAICCPEYVELITGLTLGIPQTLSSNGVFYACSQTIASAGVANFYPDGGDYSSSLNVAAGVVVNAISVQIAWQQSDIHTTTFSPFTSVLQAQPTRPLKPNTISSPNLSAYQSIAIGIGVPIVVVGSVLLLAILLGRRRRTSARTLMKEARQEIARSEETSMLTSVHSIVVHPEPLQQASLLRR